MTPEPIENVIFTVRQLAEEAEAHRIEYQRRAVDVSMSHPDPYWRGRMDEAGHFRDRLLAFLGVLNEARALAALPKEDK